MSMLLLENYIKYNVLDNKIYFNDLDLEDFGYENNDELELDLDFLIDTLFNNYQLISDSDSDTLTNQNDTRTGQKTFREKLLNKYGKCIISGCKSSKEIQAAHIIPYCEDRQNFMISNGLLLKSNLHTTFDAFYWTINPGTFQIEINTNIDNDELGEIKNYQGMIVSLEKADLLLYKNLEKRYQDFKNTFNKSVIKNIF